MFILFSTLTFYAAAVPLTTTVFQDARTTDEFGPSDDSLWIKDMPCKLVTRRIISFYGHRILTMTVGRGFVTVPSRDGSEGIYTVSAFHQFHCVVRVFLIKFCILHFAFFKNRTRIFFFFFSFHVWLFLVVHDSKGPHHSAGGLKSDHPFTAVSYLPLYRVASPSYSMYSRPDIGRHHTKSDRSKTPHDSRMERNACLQRLSYVV